MIESNLRVLLAERNIRITKVAEDTGISRTTLTSLVYGNAQGIQFDTIDKLCRYLRISPGHFFVFAPFAFSVRCDSLDYFDLLIDEGADTITVSLVTIWEETMTAVNDETAADGFAPELVSANCYIDYPDASEFQKGNQWFRQLLEKLPMQLRQHLHNKVEQVLRACYVDKRGLDPEIDIGFSWPDE